MVVMVPSTGKCHTITMITSIAQSTKKRITRSSSVRNIQSTNSNSRPVDRCRTASGNKSQTVELKQVLEGYI